MTMARIEQQAYCSLTVSWQLFAILHWCNALVSDEGMLWQATCAEMQILQQCPNLELLFLLESDRDSWIQLYGGLQGVSSSSSVFATLLQEAR